ncbi:MAG: polysaccharide biosynthesis tyrosine autokinase [Deltaproteobacteria bacterium]|nr:polysaccharide biosynthesis tyrosine autokinase [Deltaproteobacteria bacterium]
MGKISDALARQKKEQNIQVDPLPIKVPERIVPKDEEAELVKRASIGRSYSPKLVVLSAPESLDAENFKVLRAQILFPRNGNRPRTIMITSAQPGEGKTFVAANLAASIALSIDEHVLLLDCDLRQPTLHNILGYDRSEGLYELLTGKKDFSQLVISTSIDKLSFLAAGKGYRRATELLGSSLMENFLKKLKQQHADHFVIIDATPCQLTSEATVLAKYVDGVVLVVRARKTPRKDVQKAIETVGREKLMGVVFNGYEQARKRYDKYYSKRAHG